MSRRKMIGAHVARKPKKHNGNTGREKAREFNRAFDEVFAKKPGRTHLAFAATVASIRVK